MNGDIQNSSLLLVRDLTKFPSPSNPHHRPALVTLPVGCKHNLLKMSAMFRRQFPDRKFFNSGHLRIKTPVKYLIPRRVVRRRSRFAFNGSSAPPIKSEIHRVSDT